MASIRSAALWNSARAKQRGGDIEDDHRRSSFEERPDLDWLEPDECAFFFDLDGTLSGLAPTPDEASIPHSTIAALRRLSERPDSAIAILSGRGLKEIDRLTMPLRLCAAGTHGLECRNDSGQILTETLNDAQLNEAYLELNEFADRNKLLLEKKRGAICVHFRSNPSLAIECRRQIERIAQHFSAVRTLHGDMVSEALWSQRNKGHALIDFMAETPFRGKRPIAIGDDVTDEDAFEAAQRAGGIGIKIGKGKTRARIRIETRKPLLAWLHRL